MILIKSFVVVAALAVVMNGQADALIQRFCDDLKGELELHQESLDDGQKTLEIGQKFLANSFPFSKQRRLASAWKAIFEREECSASSWEHLLLMGVCNPDNTMRTIIEPTKAYANKCLTSHMVSKRIKSDVSGMFIFNADFVSSPMIRKYYLDNPEDLPIVLSSYPKRSEEMARKSIGAINFAVEQYFLDIGRDPQKEFKSNRAALEHFLNSKLITPCARHSASVIWPMRQLDFVSKFFEGQSKAVIESLDQESQDSIFRYKFCENVKLHRGLVTDLVAEKFV